MNSPTTEPNRSPTRSLNGIDRTRLTRVIRIGSSIRKTGRLRSRATAIAVLISAPGSPPPIEAPSRRWRIDQSLAKRGPPDLCATWPGGASIDAARSWSSSIAIPSSGRPASVARSGAVRSTTWAAPIRTHGAACAGAVTGEGDPARFISLRPAQTLGTPGAGRTTPK